MENKRLNKTEKQQARRGFAARLFLILLFGCCALLALIPAVEYALSFRREATEISAARREENRRLSNALPEETDGGKRNINRADAAALQSAPGIGPALAQRILADREEKGGYYFLEELLDVNGIGEKRLEALRPLFFCEPIQPPGE